MQFRLALVAAVIANPMVVRNEQFDALKALLESEVTGSTVSMLPVELGYNRYEEERMSVEQIAD